MADCINVALRIVLVGKTGSGKSATANTILGEDKFSSKIAAKSVTATCQKAFRKWNGRELLVVDTPGLFDTKETMDTTCREITRCVVFSCPGPHAIILVIQLGRYTEEEQKTVALIKLLFGKAAMKYMIVLFTRKEELEDTTLPGFLEEDSKLKSIVQECGSRCLAFNNRAGEAEKEEQVQELVQLIEKMVQDNGGGYFSDDIYKDAEERVTQCQIELEKEYTDQFNDKISRLSRDHSTEAEEQKKIEELLRDHSTKMENSRREAEEKASENIFKYIWKKMSSFWHMLWS